MPPSLKISVKRGKNGRNIPAEFREDWDRTRTANLLKRIRVFCVAFLFVFVVGNIFDVYFYPDYVSVFLRVLSWLILFGFLGIGLYISRRFPRYRILKVLSYCLVAFTLIYFNYLAAMTMTAQDESRVDMIIILILSLFFISVTIPWRVWEILLLTFLHWQALAYNFFALIGPEGHIRGRIIGTGSFIDGSVYLLMAGILCAIVRHHDNTHTLKNFLLLKEIEKKNKQMERELELASRVHRTLVPKSIMTPQADIFVTYLPLHDVGGDYAKFEFLDKDRVLFLIGDVTGHGVPAALLVNRLHTEFQHLIRDWATPGQLLKQMNAFIMRDFEDTGMYLSAFCGLLDFKEKTFRYSNYGHPPQYLYQVRSASVTRFESQTTVLGLEGEDVRAIYENKVSFENKDRLLLFTDGVLEVSDEKGDWYGAKRLETFLRDNAGLTGQIWNERLIQGLESFKATPWQDDIFILNIEIKGG